MNAPDHPTATPREPTMADAIAHFEREVGWRTAFAEQLRKDGASPREVAEWTGSAAHYRDAIAAMRAVSGEPVDLGDLVREMRQCVESRPPLYAYGDNEAACAMAETIREMADRVTEVCEAVRVSPLCAFPTTPARDA